MAVGDIYATIKNNGTFTWQPAGTNVFLITSIYQGYAVRLNIEDGANNVQIIHATVTLTAPNPLQKIFISNSHYFVWDTVGAGETTQLTAMQMA
jgi:hypothetical protein